VAAYCRHAKVSRHTDMGKGHGHSPKALAPVLSPDYPFKRKIDKIVLHIGLRSR
jgi:hypothetical protein